MAAALAYENNMDQDQIFHALTRFEDWSLVKESDGRRPAQSLENQQVCASHPSKEIKIEGVERATAQTRSGVTISASASRPRITCEFRGPAGRVTGRTAVPGVPGPYFQLRHFLVSAPSTRRVVIGFSCDPHQDMKSTGGMSCAVGRSRENLSFQILKPILRAYVLGYLSSVTPKFVSYVRRLGRRDGITRQEIHELLKVLAGPLRVNSFPTFCVALVSGSTLLPILFSRTCASVLARCKGDFLTRGVRLLVQFVTAFVSAWISFGLLNKSRGPLHFQAQAVSSTPVVSDAPAHRREPLTRPALVGRTMDLTLFTVTRSVDVIACILWSRWSRHRKAQNRWTLAESCVPGLADAAVFASSAAIVMWAWFYLPERLPRTYEKWIGEVAKVDFRLIEALRRARWGTFVYGKETGQAHLLQSMCWDYQWPEEWGDPAKTVPIPCEMVHMGCGPSCEKHAVSRFTRTFKIACATYIPLQMILRFRRIKSAPAAGRVISEAAQSSAFLASFVSLFYYSVCLARTRLGPKIFDPMMVTPMMWDSGLCVGAGCLMCGWSVLVEKARKRQELALFVAPRAAATVLPRLYDQKYQYRERIAFAVSAAILLTSIRENPRMVRGVFGRITTSVLN
ncbi:uncharacterized protein N7459_008864 [Penicillium hispanicum]|uniref:uncharacterized protein n=1 Tax=Penicillium hispanicum TaxID=1080232 RepID=UPI002540BAC8|nr:uncharacterized protein N7459_008864 [Penicillium hispanicum]KAJ5569434.1 hypothetical protein N7459_008864 [Penicillium hispanicum]